MALPRDDYDDDDDDLVVVATRSTVNCDIVLHCRPSASLLSAH